MSKKFNYAQIQGIKANLNVSDEFVKAVEKMADRLKTKPEYILAAMSFETGGSFSPSITNSIGVTGLIQFLKTNNLLLAVLFQELLKTARTCKLLKRFKIGWLLSDI